MGLGGGASTALDNAVKAAVADGVTFAVAAGNDGGLLGELTGCCRRVQRLALAGAER